jgi:hypothetical protein
VIAPRILTTALIGRRKFHAYGRSGLGNIALSSRNRRGERVDVTPKVRGVNPFGNRFSGKRFFFFFFFKARATGAHVLAIFPRSERLLNTPARETGFRNRYRLRGLMTLEGRRRQFRHTHLSLVPVIERDAVVVSQNR